MDGKTIQSEKGSHTVLVDNENEEIINDKNLEFIKQQIEEFLNTNFIIKNLVRSFPTSRKVIGYIPKFILIVARDREGLELLKESGLLDAIQNRR